MDNPRERITSEREAQVDGGQLGGVRDPVRPSALCTPTSLFSLRFSAFHQQTVTPTLLSPKPTLQQRAHQPQKETPKPVSRLHSACIWIQPSVPGQHRAPLLHSVLQSLQRGAPLLKIYPFNSLQNTTSLHLLVVLLWLQSVVVLFQLYSIFLSPF